MVIENRGGGGGIVAATQVARAEPDGYTLLMGGLAPQILGAGDRRQSRLRSRSGDFTPVAYVGGPPIRSGGATIERTAFVGGLVAAAKADKFSGYASSGVGTLGHLVVGICRQSSRAEAYAHSLQYSRRSPTSSPAACRWARSPGARRSVRCRVARSRAGGENGGATSGGVRACPTFKELATIWSPARGSRSLRGRRARRTRSCSDLNQEIIRILELPEIKKLVIQDAFDPKLDAGATFGLHGNRDRALATDRASGVKKQ